MKALAASRGPSGLLPHFASCAEERVQRPLNRDEWPPRPALGVRRERSLEARNLRGGRLRLPVGELEVSQIGINNGAESMTRGRGVLLLVLCYTAAASSSQRRGSSYPSSLLLDDRDSAPSIRFPIEEGQQPGDFPARRYDELLRGSEVDRWPPQGEGNETQDATRGGRNVLALVKDWTRLNLPAGPTAAECRGIVLGMVAGHKHVAVVTTASLPWLTGTAVNPLLRAGYLAKRGVRVTLLLPWLDESEQTMLYAEGLVFPSPVDQERYIRAWLARRAGLGPEVLGDRLDIEWYAARYHREKGSLLALGDLTQVLSGPRDVCILEEPEHLNWYHHGEHWCQRWELVIGVVHTNYWEYARSHETGGLVAATAMQIINRWMCSWYCHRSIKLSDALPPLPRSITANTHGVRDEFLRVGDKFTSRTHTKGAYFLGKMLWAKGYGELFDLLNTYAVAHGEALTDVHVYGSGPDRAAIEARAARLRPRVRVTLHKAVDHARDELHEYKIFVNPCKSDVLCTTTAEALAMGKFVVVEDNPSNEFFKRLPNCLTFSNAHEFCTQLHFALRSRPAPVDAAQRYLLSWEAATDRLLDAMTVRGGGQTALRCPPAEPRSRARAPGRAGGHARGRPQHRRQGGGRPAPTPGQGPLRRLEPVTPGGGANRSPAPAPPKCGRCHASTSPRPREP